MTLTASSDPFVRDFSDRRGGQARGSGSFNYSVEWISWERQASECTFRDLRGEPHAAYLALGAMSEVRWHGYHRLFDDAIDVDETETIRRYLQRQQALGSQRFQTQIETMLQRRVGPARIGRRFVPKKRGQRTSSGSNSI